MMTGWQYLLMTTCCASTLAVLLTLAGLLVFHWEATK